MKHLKVLSLTCVLTVYGKLALFYSIHCFEVFSFAKLDKPFYRIAATCVWWELFNWTSAAPRPAPLELEKQKPPRIWQKRWRNSVLSSTVPRVLITRWWVGFSLVSPSQALGVVLMSSIELTSRCCRSLPNSCWPSGTPRLRGWVVCHVLFVCYL